MASPVMQNLCMLAGETEDLKALVSCYGSQLKTQELIEEYEVKTLDWCLESALTIHQLLKIWYVLIYYEETDFFLNFCSFTLVQLFHSETNTLLL